MGSQRELEEREGAASERYPAGERGAGVGAVAPSVGFVGPLLVASVCAGCGGRRLFKKGKAFTADNA